MPSSITLGSTPTHTRCCIKYLCPALLSSRLVVPGFVVNWIEVRARGQGYSAVTNLEVHRSDHDLLDYCTFGLEAANVAQNVRVDTACGKDHHQRNLSKMIM